ASETQGIAANAGVGTDHRDFAGARYGGAAGDAVHYRAYAKYQDDVGYDPGHDDWWMARAGFRTDAAVAQHHTGMALGDTYDGRLGERVAIPSLTPPFTQSFNQHVPVRGGDLLARWTYKTPGGSQVSVQSFFESTLREGGFFNERRDTV